MTTQPKAADPVREAFERWASDDGVYPTAVERAGHGYQLAQTQSYWVAWQAAYAQARADLIAELRPAGYLTRNDDGDPAMLFFDRAEALTYCGDDEPEALAAIPKE